MADIAWQGQSGIINEGKLGNDRERALSMIQTSSSVCILLPINLS